MADIREREAAEILWHFMSSQDELGRPTAIFVFGSTDLIVAAFAAVACFETSPEAIICSGGIAHVDDLLRSNWRIPEAEAFAAVLTRLRVPERIIYLERKATNTGENFDLSLALAEHHGLRLDDVLIIHKPYMTLRTRLTGRVRWPLRSFRVSAPHFTFAEYSRLVMPENHLINILVGDFQRVVEYPKRGLSANCAVPKAVQDAFDFLVQLGYTKHLLSV